MGAGIGEHQRVEAEQGVKEPQFGCKGIGTHPTRLAHLMMSAVAGALGAGSGWKVL
jgi:hypothetical protein